MEVWGINIYGVNVSDLKKKKELENMDIEDVDFIEPFCEKHVGLTWASTGSEMYIGISPIYPWESVAKDMFNKFSSYEKMEEFLIATLQEICDNSTEELKQMIDYISDYGLG